MAMRWFPFLILGALVITAYTFYQILFNDFTPFATTLPQIVLSDRLEDYVQVDRCEIHSAEFHCNLTNILPDSQIGIDVGDIGINLLSATYHDKNGNKLGGRRLPSRKISSGESIRDVIAKYPSIGEIDTIRIDWD